MGGIEVKVDMDTRALVQQLEQAATKMTSAIASGLNKSARTARREAIKVMARDIGRPASEFKSATPVIRRASPGNLKATWSIGKRMMGALPVGQFVPVRSALQGSYSGSTFKVSGGGSSHLSIERSFIMPGKGSGGKGLLFVRTGKGRNAIHAVAIEMPSTSMAQEGDAPRQTWTKIAEAEVAKNVSTAVGLAINGQSVGIDEGAD